MKWPYTAIILAILAYTNEGSSLPTLLAIGMAYLMVSNYRELRSQKIETGVMVSNSNIFLVTFHSRARTKEFFVCWFVCCSDTIAHLTHIQQLEEQMSKQIYGNSFNSYKLWSQQLDDWSDLETRRANIDRPFFYRIIADDAAVDKNKFLLDHSEHNTRHGATRSHINTDVRK